MCRKAPELGGSWTDLCKPEAPRRGRLAKNLMRTPRHDIPMGVVPDSVRVRKDPGEPEGREKGVDSPTYGGPSVAASVIISAHDRRQYLRDAVESVWAQDVDRSEYELIVVKNFPDDDIDALLDRQGARRILCQDGPVSLKFAKGLKASRGNIVLLLDDDDLFERTKLRTVLNAFESDPTLGFYHNQVSYIGSKGKTVDPRLARVFGLRPSGRARRTLITKDAKNDGLARLAYNYPDFNDSSLAIRRDLAVGSAPFLARLEGGVDTFFFFVALISPYSLLFDNAPLTRYRIHDENASLAMGTGRDARRAQLLAAARRQNQAYEVIREMVLHSGDALALRELDARILVIRLAAMFRGQQSGRLDAVRALIRGVGLRRTFAVRENVPSMAGAVLFALAPQLARTAYEYHVAIR